MQSNDQIQFLGKERIPKLMLKFSIPCILSLLVSALYNIVDQIFIGNSELSALGNAATGVVFPIFIIAQAFAWCFGDGCAAYLPLLDKGKHARNHGICLIFCVVLNRRTSSTPQSSALKIRQITMVRVGECERSKFASLQGT